MPAVNYDELARFYDALVTDQSDLPYFRDLARRANGPVAEFMAGSGRLSVPIAAEGVDLTCIDSSQEMLAHLRKKLADKETRARLVRGDVTNVELETQFALILLRFTRSRSSRPITSGVLAFETSTDTFRQGVGSCARLMTSQLALPASVLVGVVDGDSLTQSRAVN
jgi:SAM-dependent methyltransferase